MVLGNVRILTMAPLSDAFEGWYTLLENTYEHDGKLHTTNEISFFNGDAAYDLFESDILAKAEEMGTNNYDKVAWKIYSDFCHENNILLISYSEMEELERILRENDK